MSAPQSLRRNLSLGLAAGLTSLWLVAMAGAYFVIRAELEEVYDSLMARAAETLLPLAVHGSDADLDAGGERLLTWVLRDAAGQIVQRSNDARSRSFTEIPPQGFSSRDGFRHLVVQKGAVSLDLASPLKERREATWSVMSGLGLLALGLLPLSMLGVAWFVRNRLRPIESLSREVGDRHPGDLSPLTTGDLQQELLPIREEVNRLMQALQQALEAERAFSANAAHELRTPIAAVLAHVQRLAAEVPDGPLKSRTARIEAELKRVTRLAEKLLQLARAERVDDTAEEAVDLVPILALTAADFGVPVVLPEGPLISRLGAESFAILARNLIENATVHGTNARASLSAGGVLRVTNAGRIVPPEALNRLTHRFERGGARTPGSGLGLAIVEAVVERNGLSLSLRSPIPGNAEGFEARVEGLRSGL